MSNGKLEVLKQNRTALLLAEVAAWLHDMGKCADEHIVHEASDAPPQHRYDYKKDSLNYLPSPLPKIALLGEKFLPPIWVLLRRRPSPLPKIALLGERTCLKDLVEKGMPRIIKDTSQPWIVRALGRCHAAAHIEKEEADRSGKQRQNDTRLSTAFGFEGSPLSGLTGQLKNLPFSQWRDRRTFLDAVRKTFTNAPGDTRRPENEVTLWDWSSTVAALYKAALAGALLGYQPEPNKLRWRLLSVRFDGLTFFAQSHRLPDLLARRKLLNEALEQVRELLEEEYPLGTEVYRDEDGSVFVVPGCENGSPDILALQDGGKTLHNLILERVRNRLEGEAVPTIQIDEGPWWGQDPQRKGKDKIPPIPDHLRPVVSAADPTWVKKQWSGGQEICTVCGLRPQGPSTKAQSRNVCDTCEQRRADRSREWATQRLYTTIWTDEVADENGRLALVVGRFGLEKWLDGTLVQTLTVSDPAQDSTSNKAKVVRKTPSFARLRRIWETTQRFWQTALEEKDAQDNPIIPSVQGRWRITPQNSPNVDEYHTYDLLLDGRRLSVLWDGQVFITCDNLAYFEKIAGTPLQDLLQSGRTYELWTPAGYGEETRKVADVTIGQPQQDATSYTPAIPILAEPHTFMALLPANRALEVAKAIQTKYEREMGKVRNRLPLTLGVVYFGRRTPLAAAIETGRRILGRPTPTQTWEVTSKTDCNPMPSGWPMAVCLTLKRNDREISLSIPTVMGDGQTKDVWYPYWRVEGQPSDRTRYFVGPDGEHWVHVAELRRGDRVGFMPSTLDFEHLDTTARRFEVIYDQGDGRRRETTKRQRPYLLEEIETLEAVWQQVKNLPTSQIHQLEMLIEGKRRTWGEPRGTLQVSPTFRQFVQDTLREAGIQSDVLERAALRGVLSDALEIHMTIHKEKP